MSTHSLLIFAPGIPVVLDSFLPKSMLALLAASLEEAGHYTRIWDFGTAEFLEEIQAAPAQGSASERPFLTKLFELSTRPAPKYAVGSGFEKWVNATVGKIRAGARNDFLLFYAGTAADLATATAISAQLKTDTDRPTIILCGPYVEQQGHILFSKKSCFDCGLVGDTSLALTTIARNVRSRMPWSSVPNLVYFDGSKANATRRVTTRAVDLPPGYFDPELYPAVQQTQFKYFSIHRDALPNTRERIGTNDVAFMEDNRVLPGICDEASTIQQRHPQAVFHLSAPRSSCWNGAALAASIHYRRLSIRYSLRSAPIGFDQGAMASLHNSGCRALGLDLISGSKRLLEDFYGEKHGICRAEQLLRASRRSNLFTAAHFTFPCPWDDYHTQDETWRLIRLGEPHAVSIAPHDPDDYGIHKFAVQSNWTPERQAQERDALLADTETLGILSGCTEREGFIARHAAYIGDEAAFVEKLRKALAGNQAAALAEIISDFNAGAAAELAPERAMQEVRAAVGN